MSIARVPLDADFRAFSLSATSLDVSQEDVKNCNDTNAGTPDNTSIRADENGVAENTTKNDSSNKLGEKDNHNEINANKSRYVTAKDFEMLKVIGLGAFGKVLQVRKRKSGDVLAIKVITKRLLRKRVSYVQNIQAERDILTKINHPFIVKMHCSFQTAEKLFIIMDFCAGGELFLRLGREGIFLEKTAAFYLSEIILALEHLHSRGVLHRDLKPENILLQASGHLALTDFGLAKDFSSSVFEDDDTDPDNRALTICGTGEYMAPEMIAKKGYGKAADFWSLGCIAYEMLSGNPPFESKKGTKDLFRKILNERVRMPDGASAPACKLLKGLLNRDASKRLGSAKGTMFKVGGVSELKQADFFLGLDWRLLELEEIDPPQILSVENEEDLKNFHDEFVSMAIPRSVKEMTKEDFKPNRCESFTFRGFSFVMDDFDLPDRKEMEVDHYWNHVDDDTVSKSSCASSLFNDKIDSNEQPQKKKRPPRKRKKNKDKVVSEEDSCLENNAANGTVVNNVPSSNIKDDPIPKASDSMVATSTNNEASKDINPSSQEKTSQVSAPSVVAQSITTAKPKVVEPQWQSISRKPQHARPKQRLATYSKPNGTQSGSYISRPTSSHMSLSKTTLPPHKQQTSNVKSNTPPPGSWAAMATVPKEAASSIKQIDPRMKQRPIDTASRQAPLVTSNHKDFKREPPLSSTPKLAVQEKYWPSLSSGTKSAKPSDTGNKSTKEPKLQGSWGSKMKPKIASTNSGAWN